MDKQEIIGKLLDLLVKEENPDSLEVGTPAKQGGIKIYGNFARPEEFQKKIDAAFEMRAYAQRKTNNESVPG